MCVSVMTQRCLNPGAKQKIPAAAKPRGRRTAHRQSVSELGVLNDGGENNMKIILLIDHTLPCMAEFQAGFCPIQSALPCFSYLYGTSVGER